MMSPAAMISVAGFEELQTSAREQLGAAAPPPWADDAPLTNGLRLSFGTADGEPTTFQFVPTLYDTVYPTPTSNDMDLSPTQALRHIDNVDSDPLPNTDADKVRDVGAIRRLLLHRDTQQWLDRGPTNGVVPYTSNCGAALGRDNTQKELGRIGGRLAGHVGDNRYVAEITRDGRSKCTYKDCRQPLIKGEYRLGKRPPSVRYGHSPKTRWYHIDCCFKSFASVTKKSKTITSLDDIERVRHVFPPSEVARIERLIAEHKVRLSSVDAAPPPKKRRAPSPIPLVAGPTAGLPRPRTAPVRVVQATPPVRVANTAPPPLKGVTPRAKDPTFDLEPISTPSAYMMPIHEAGLDLFACPTPPASNCPTPTCPL
jgi:hypothetical protein